MFSRPPSVSHRPALALTLATALAGLSAAARAAAQPTTGGVTPAVDTRTERRTAPRVTRKPAAVTAPPKVPKVKAPRLAPPIKPAAKPLRPTVPAADSGHPARDTAAARASAGAADRGVDKAVGKVEKTADSALGRSDSARRDSSVTPAFGAAARPAVAPLPPDPNIPGAPNVAGRISGTLARDAVLAPIDSVVGPGRGPAVVHLQVLLDLARFSPGAVSGVWNENTVYALRAFRAIEELPKSDSADALVVERLERRARNRPVLTEYAVTAADARGPFRRLSGSMYAQAKLDCLCYQSMAELLGERFHATVELLRALNPGVDLAHAAPGTRLVVPNVDRGAAPAVARLVVDKRESSMRGLDAKGATRFYLPVTVGSPGLPSPTGRYKVVSATLNPRYHYDPVVLGEATGVAKDALLPPGPNSPVGVLWAQLSRPHVGLHGTPYPEEVGYTMSHGCVRMANWDARWVTPILKSGLVVDFK